MSRRDPRIWRRNPSGIAVSVPVPKTIPGLMAWYRSDLGITTVSGRVSAWADQSGSGDANRNLVQAVAGNRPTIVASDASFNGRPSLTFASADPDLLDRTGAWSAAIVQPATIYSVHMVTSLAAQVTYYDDSAVSGSFGLAQSLGAGFIARAGASIAGVDNTTNKPTAMCVVFNGASSAYYDAQLTATVSGNAGANGSTGLVVGTQAGAGAGLQGSICEIIVYSGAHNGTQRSTLLSYLGTLYNITIGA